eukprot:COSAG06_NODE_895_length_11669_cov_5.131384_4_plen_57_part_00
MRNYHPEYALDTEGEPWNVTAYQCLEADTTGCGVQMIKQVRNVFFPPKRFLLETMI